MDNNTERYFEINGTDWVLEVAGVQGKAAENFVLKRKNGKNFHVTMVEDSIFDKEKGLIKFRQPMLFEHSQGKDRAGDILITLRQGPSGRYFVHAEEDNVFVDEANPSIIEKIFRAMRSSIDNPNKAVKRTVRTTGEGYLNTRRIGGKTVKTHYFLAAWSPQFAGEMMDIYDYVQSLDIPGLAALMKALQDMPDQLAKLLFEQIRMPAAE